MTIGDRPAARVGDKAACRGGPADAIVKGAASVFIGDQMAARVGDAFDHGGVVSEGCPTVFIGSSTQSAVMHEAAMRGASLVEECPKADGQWRPAPDQAETLLEAAKRGASFVEECTRRAQ